MAQKTYNPIPSLQKSLSFDERPVASPRGIMDTLIPGAFQDTCGRNVFSFTITDRWGFLAGTNEFGDLQKAQRFTFDRAEEYTVQEVWVFFAERSAVNDGDVTINIYDADGNGAPSTLVGTSAPVRASELNVDPNAVVATIFTFDTPPTVNTPQYFASVDLTDLYANNDTVGILISQNGCGDGSDSWEQFSDGSTWVSIDDADNSWDLEANFLIFSIVDFMTTSVDDPFVSEKGLTLYPAAPNPAGDFTRLSYDLDQDSEVRIEIYSADGRLIQNIDKGHLPTGEHQEFISLDQFPAGQYVYGIVTENARIMSKFVVNP